MGCPYCYDTPADERRKRWPHCHLCRMWRDMAAYTATLPREYDEADYYTLIALAASAGRERMERPRRDHRA